jgi:lipopolysaccharide transport system permease protein
VVITVLISRNPFHALLLPLPIAALIVLSLGVAFFVSSLYVFFRDIPYLYELVTFLLWLTVPIFYPVAIVPEQVRAFLWINPLYPVIESLRQIALDRGMPDFSLMGIAGLEALGVQALGCLVFAVNRRKFMDFV